MKTQNTAFVRASISFPDDVYRILEGLAKKKKVSLAWIVRDAAETYIAQTKSKDGRQQRSTMRGSGKLGRREA